MTETEPSSTEPAPAISDILPAERELPRIPPAELPTKVQEILGVSRGTANFLVQEAERLYINRMAQRFSGLNVAERLKRTNPFLLRIRGLKTVREWADLQLQSTLYASEEEATGHLLEAIAKACFPGARTPTIPADFDFEVAPTATEIQDYQVKMSWDCMPMSSRKNLSNTINMVQAQLAAEGKDFTGIFASCYGKKTTTRPKGQTYVSLASKEFWRRVGNGRQDFDVSVGEVCALLCAESRVILRETLIPKLLDNLTDAVLPVIGNPDGSINYTKLFRRING